MVEHVLYTRNQIHDAERFAWAGTDVAGEPQFFFDGISFWRRDGDGGTERVLADEVPDTGWWHRPRCNCPLCRSLRESTRRHGSRKRT